ncbi:MAG: dienelactone hydrolase family protein [Pseudomonadales bacterium]
MTLSQWVGTCLLLTAALTTGFVTEESSGSHQLQRIPYVSEVNGEARHYFVYLPEGYAEKPDYDWPVMLFLHGHGERGNGNDELDNVLRHGPLREAWIQRRSLTFIIISPQLPVQFGIPEVDDGPADATILHRLEEGTPPRNHGFKSDVPIQRGGSADFVAGNYQMFEPYPVPGKIPPGWISIESDLLMIVDNVLETRRADPLRVYLTGISYGGFGTFDLAARHPERWAAIAPIVGTGKLSDASVIADAQLPVWMFGGGKDTQIKPHWLYEMAAAMEAAGHPALRFTIHEDMDHDAWKRVYAGEDLYNWLLGYTLGSRPD